MDEPRSLDVTPWRARDAIRVALLLAALHLPLQLRYDGFHNVDGPYHARFVLLMGREPLAPAFRWTRESTWAERFADKELLFHAWLWPFARAGEVYGDIARGTKLGLAVLLIAQGLLWHELLRRAGVRHPLVWLLLLQASGAMYLYRMSLLRPHALGVTLLAALALLCARRSPRGARLIALIFPLAYVAAHAAIAVALLVALIWSCTGRPAAWSQAGWLALCVAIGIGIHPHFPNNLDVWWAQNVVLPIAAQDPAFRSDIGREFFSPAGESVARHLTLIPLLWFACLLLALEGRARAADDTLALFALAGAFGGLTLVSMRFVEHWAPLTIFAAACWHRDLVRAAALPAVLVTVWQRPAGRTALGMILLLLLLQSWSNTAATIELQPSKIADFRGAAQWLAHHAAPNEPVWHPSFDNFPGLFFHAPAQSYLVAMDPVFCYARDVTRYELWRSIALGQHDDPVRAIRDDFGCRLVVVDEAERHVALLAQLAANPCARAIDLGPDAHPAVKLFELVR
jgi:hypothetical protein